MHVSHLFYIFAAESGRDEWASFPSFAIVKHFYPDMNNTIRTLTVRFINDISQTEIPYFRGAIIASVSSDNLLFHNHLSEGFRYSYPLIQYKRIRGKAAVVCLAEGADAIGNFFEADGFDVKIGERPVKLEVDTVKANRVLVQLWDAMFTYRLNRWLPLNAENYAAYRLLESDEERQAMLERMLTGNILSFAKCLGIFFDRQVECRILTMKAPNCIAYKGTKMLAFDVEFMTNVSLPDYIGLGKGVSLGNGTVTRKFEKKNEKDNE